MDAHAEVCMSDNLILEVEWLTVTGFRGSGVIKFVG